MLAFEAFKDEVARQRIHAEKPPHLRFRQLQARHFPVLGLDQSEEVFDAWFYCYHAATLSKRHA
jgi:hypothetical protein